MVYTLDSAEDDMTILSKNLIIANNSVGQIALDECGERLVICDASGCTIQIYLSQQLPFAPKPAMTFIRGSKPVQLVGKMQIVDLNKTQSALIFNASSGTIHVFKMPSFA